MKRAKPRTVVNRHLAGSCMAGGLSNLDQFRVKLRELKKLLDAQSCKLKFIEDQVRGGCGDWNPLPEGRKVAQRTWDPNTVVNAETVIEGSNKGKRMLRFKLPAELFENSYYIRTYL